MLAAIFTFWARKRRFDRTNTFGIQQFKSYWEKIGAEAKDFTLKGLAIILMCSGMLILAFNHTDTWGLLIVLPVLAFLLFLLLGS
jgi:hypothetical protein